MFEICNISQHLLLFADRFYMLYLQARGSLFVRHQGYLFSISTATFYICVHNILPQASECALPPWQIDMGEINENTIYVTYESCQALA
jgi:hypothetical protein